MTWIAPWALAAAGAAAVLVGILHLLARDRPPRWLLPTARFVAAGTAQATRRARRPKDLPLMVLRMLAILLAGAAFAGPILAPAGGSIARVVLLDRSARVADPVAAAELARARLREGDRLVLFDTTAVVVARGAEPAAIDSVVRTRSGSAAREADPAAERQRFADRASLSAALVAAIRVAMDAAAGVDSVAIAVISPLDGAVDAATMAIRREWPGRIELVPVGGIVARDDGDAALHVRGPAGDPLVAAMRLLGATPVASDAPVGPRSTLLVRNVPSAADSAHALSGGALVVWPVSVDSTAARRDTVGGLVVDGIAVPFVGVRSGAAPPGEPLAHWIDGVPAVTEIRLGDGCVRTAAVTLPVAGDLTLRPGFLRALRSLVRPCGSARPAPASDTVRALLAGSGPLANAASMRRDASRSAATPWLLAAALALLLLEPLLRRARAEGRA